MIAVTGITGHSGRFFLQELIAHQVTEPIRCLVRGTSDTTVIDNSGLQIEKYVGDLSNEESLRGFLQGAQTLVHITNIRYSLNLVRIAHEIGVNWVVLVHTTGIYSKFKMASDEYKQIEEDLQPFLDSEMDITVLRPTMIFGDMCDHNIRKFIKMVDQFLVMPEIDHGACLIQPVNARDLGKAYYQVMCCRHLSEKYYDLSGERTVSMHELFALIGNYLGKKVHFLSVPLSVGSTGARVLRAISFGKIDYVERVLRMGENRNYAHKQASRDFDYQPERFEVGLLREVTEYMQTKGEYHEA